MKVELDLPEIKGFEYTGEWRDPKKGEYYMYNRTFQKAIRLTTDIDVPILKKKEPEYLVFDSNVSRPVSQSGKYVSINALEDAMQIIKDCGKYIDLEGGEISIINSLRKLIEENQPKESKNV